jgi:SAM-dependent methyltransferase
VEALDAESPGCPLCGGVNARPVYGTAFHGRLWTLVRCAACGLHRTCPAPTDADIGSFYEGDYHRELRQQGAAEAKFGAKYQRYVATLRKHLASGRVLDIGCSTGLLVRMLRDAGYAAEGVEANEQSAAWGRSHYQVSIHHASLSACGFRQGDFDAVLLMDVLEHRDIRRSTFAR